jgi:hypothetical protein
MSRTHDVWSRRISLVEHSRSSFCSGGFLCMCAGEDVPPMRAGFPTRTHWHRSSDGADPLLGQRVCALRER